MLPTLNEICVWIDQTALSQAIQVTNWVVPTVQTIHILAIAVVASSVLMIDLRLIGAFWADRPVREVSARFLPLVWWTLIILFVTGAVMIVAARLGGVGAAGPCGEVSRGSLPLVWWTLIILFVTGAVMIVAEPSRSLKNP